MGDPGAGVVEGRAKPLFARSERTDHRVEIPRPALEGDHQRAADAHEQNRSRNDHEDCESRGGQTGSFERGLYFGQVDLRDDTEVEHGDRFVGGEDHLSPVVETDDGSRLSTKRPPHRLGEFGI